MSPSPAPDVAVRASADAIRRGSRHALITAELRACFAAVAGFPAAVESALSADAPLVWWELSSSPLSALPVSLPRRLFAHPRVRRGAAALSAVPAPVAADLSPAAMSIMPLLLAEGGPPPPLALLSRSATRKSVRSRRTMQPVGEGAGVSSTLPLFAWCASRCVLVDEHTTMVFMKTSCAPHS